MTETGEKIKRMETFHGVINITGDFEITPNTSSPSQYSLFKRGEESDTIMMMSMMNL